MIAHGWDDVFLDLDPERGLKAGERWRDRRTLSQKARAAELGAIGLRAACRLAPDLPSAHRPQSLHLSVDALGVRRYPPCQKRQLGESLRLNGGPSGDTRDRVRRENGRSKGWDMSATQAAEPKRLKVFISYSRKDVAFAQTIVAALEARGVAPKIDTRDLPKLEDWRRELLGFVREADAVVFIVSQNSISSPVCEWEVEQVASLNKRLAPIVLERVADDQLPTDIAKINYLFFDQPEDFEARVDELAEALQTDLVWVKEHTRLGELARRWDERQRAAGLTLPGQELQGAERWIASRPRGAPQPTDLQKAFISESRRAATRRMYFAIAGAFAFGVVAIGLAVVAYSQSRLAEANRKNAVNVLATSDFRQGTSLLENDESTSEGLALLSRSAREGHDSRALMRLWTLLQQRSFWLPAGAQAVPPAGATHDQQGAVPDGIKQKFKNVIVDGVPREVKFISVSADGKRVFTSIGDVAEDTDCQYRVWRSDGRPITSWTKPTYTGWHYVYETKGYLSADGMVLVLEVIPWREVGYLQVFDLAHNKQIGENIPASGPMPFVNASVRFDRVELIQEAPPKDEAFNILLLTVSQKGDATVFRLWPSQVETIVQNRHSQPVAFAGLDENHEWLMSSSSDGALRVSRVPDPEGEAIGAIGDVLHLDRAATSVRRVGDSGIAVSFVEGQPRFFSLRSLLKAPLGERPRVIEPKAQCKRWDDPDYKIYDVDTPENSKLLTSKGELSRLGTRQLVVLNRDVKLFTSPTFSNDVILTCLGDGGDAVSVTTMDFVTEIWTTDFSRRLGPPINERRLFREGETPESTRRVYVPQDAKTVLIESALWISPNVMVQWYSLWNLEASLPLSDRTRFDNDWSADDVMVDAAYLDWNSHSIFFEGRSKDEKLFPIAALNLAPPETADAWLPEFAEAIGGLSINDAGVFEPVADRETKLARGFDNIARLVPSLIPQSVTSGRSGQADAGPERPAAPESPTAPEPISTDAASPSASVSAIPTTTPPDPVATVKAFYLAIARADGEAAQQFLVAEQRGVGPFDPARIRRFYSRLPRPMEILDVQSAGDNVVNVTYRFPRPKGSECHGKATVHTVVRSGHTLIKRIGANC
jgi:hypothetical protein